MFTISRKTLFTKRLPARLRASQAPELTIWSRSVFLQLKP